MEHILTRCKAEPREVAWNLANELWRRRSNTPLPTRLGDIIGCGLANFKTDEKPDRGKNRLYRILVSETAYLIWKMRNERRIRDEDHVTSSASETRNRWVHALNKRLTIDRALTNDWRFGKRALDKQLIKYTWKGCIENEEDLPNNWVHAMGVLVSISTTCPSGRNQ